MTGGRAAAMLQRWRRRLIERASGDSLMLGLGAGVGLATGLLAAALIATIAFVQGLAWGDQATAMELLLVPTVGGFAVGLLLRYWAPESSGGGTLRVMSLVAMQGGRMRARVPAGGVLASGLALGTGASGGREG
ncbi:MAG: chloride channel protein, partial [Actinobacteria bacterium]|nr:chloride channel protein [Actinomycetota bacterium]